MTLAMATVIAPHAESSITRAHHGIGTKRDYVYVPWSTQKQAAANIQTESARSNCIFRYSACCVERGSYTLRPNRFGQLLDLSRASGRHTYLEIHDVVWMTN